MAHRTSLLIIDGLINLALGVVLLLFPSSLVAYLGVPDADNSFYPNILGGVLFGIAIALFVESRSTALNASGLGLLGAVVINLCAGLVLGAWLLWGGLDLPVRGTVFLWSLVILLVGISSIELATKLSTRQNS
jgi:peptidoglycan/LPS O-acetylase OafA/YrhL